MFNFMNFSNIYYFIKRKLKLILQLYFPKIFVSHNYTELQNNSIFEASKFLLNSWKSEHIPARQRKLVDRQIRKYFDGRQNLIFDVFCKSLSIYNESRTVLEIGCSTGHYSEIMKFNKITLKYSGCDYSYAFIRLAKEHYPVLDFSVQDATLLAFKDDAYDIVVSGCCILHIFEYEKAIAESARVAKHGVVFHRTPVLYGIQTKFYTKQAYGENTLEIHFNENELTDLFYKYKLNIAKKYKLNDIYDKNGHIVGGDITYVCVQK